MIDSELRGHAEDLYVVEGMTFEEVAGATGVHTRTIQGWSAQEGWPEKKREYRRTLGEIKRKTVLLRKKLIEKAFDSLDPQHVYAAARLEGLARGKDKRPDEKAADIDHPRVFLENLEFVAGFLQDRDPEGLKLLARNFDALIDAFKKRDAKTT